MPNYKIKAGQFAGLQLKNVPHEYAKAVTRKSLQVAHSYACPEGCISDTSSGLCPFCGTTLEKHQHSQHAQVEIKRTL